MRRLIYSVAISVDGFIAGPRSEYDWIMPDPAYDFLAHYRRFDTLLMGRRTYDVARTRGGMLKGTGMRIVVASSTLKPAEHPDVDVVSGDIPTAVSALKSEPGKDIWLMGGAHLFRTLVDAGLVDEAQFAVMPVLLGSGLNMLAEGRRCPLRLEKSEPYPGGMLVLTYSIPTVADF